MIYAWGVGWCWRLIRPESWLVRDWNVIGFLILLTWLDLYINENESSMKNASQNIEFSWKYTFVAPEEHQIRHAPTNLEFPRRSFAKVARAPRVTSFRLKIIFHFILICARFFSIWRLRASLASTCAAPWTNFALFEIVLVVSRCHCRCFSSLFSLHLILPGQ